MRFDTSDGENDRQVASNTPHVCNEAFSKPGKQTAQRTHLFLTSHTGERLTCEIKRQFSAFDGSFLASWVCNFDFVWVVSIDGSILGCLTRLMLFAWSLVGRNVPIAVSMVIRGTPIWWFLEHLLFDWRWSKKLKKDIYLEGKYLLRLLMPKKLRRYLLERRDT